MLQTLYLSGPGARKTAPGDKFCAKKNLRIFREEFPEV
jgi:hypothetical protein